MYFEIEINGEMYQFNFGVGFMREMNKKVVAPIPGIPGASQKIGLKMTIANILDRDIEALIDVLYTANAGFTPRLKIKDIEAHIENNETDVEALFDKVIDFFKSANCTKKATMDMLREMNKLENPE